MKLDRRNLIKAAGALSVGAAVQAEGGTPASKDGKTNFSFAFITDEHISWNMGQVRDRELPAEREDLLEVTYAGYQRALDKVMERAPVDFILSGGDKLELITYDAVRPGGSPPELAPFMAEVDQAVKRIHAIEATTGVPYFDTLGNHDTFESAPATPDNPLYAEGLFKKYFGKGRSYYSYDWKGWHFIILSTHNQKNGKRWAGFSKEQLAWLKTDLWKAGKKTPVVISAHVPFPHAGGAFKEDRKKIYEILKNYNIKLMLFGHTHSYEEFEWNGIPCVIGGSLSGAVWSGARAVRDTTFGGKTAEHTQGYLILSVSGNEIDWRFYPYNFDAEKYHYEKTRIKPYGVSMYWYKKQMEQK